MCMPTKFLLIGAPLSRNFGGPSLAITTKMVLNKFIDDAEFTLITHVPDDMNIAPKYNIRVLVAPSMKRLLPAAFLKALFNLSVGRRQTCDVINAFANADIIVDIWGLEFVDSIGHNQFIRRALQGAHLLIGKLFRKPVVKYTADLGPFEQKWNKLFAKLYLQNAVDLILARSEATRQRLKELGVTTPVKVCPDTAFLLEAHITPFAEQLMRQKHPIVGFSASYRAAEQSGDPNRYYEIMAGLINHILDSIEAIVVLIPNDLSNNIKRDDRYTAKKIKQQVLRKDRVIMLSNEYTAQELKGILGVCDVVVAARYHSIIASVSQGIPVLAIGWHDKYLEILRLVGQERFICMLDSLKLNEVREMFDELWQSRKEVKCRIEARLPDIHRAILEGGKEVSKLLERY